jgi:hypothetical protein
MENLLLPIFSSIFGVFITVVFVFLQQRWSQSRHGNAQQQKEKSVIFPPFLSVKPVA